jgi:purine-binding chemotaxis protein CheW
MTRAGTEQVTRSGTERVTRPGIDWDLVRSRVRSSERALEEALTGSPERIDAAYRLRAVRLAKGQAEHIPHAAGLPVLVFRLGQERYAIEIKEVAEALNLERCTAVPGSSPLFAGVINLRGELRAVLDLARLFELPGSADKDSGFVLLLRRHGQEIGLKVDRIEELREIQPEELSVSAGGKGKYVMELAPGTLMLLSVDAVLAEIFGAKES